jgi:hypothetical protein
MGLAKREDPIIRGTGGGRVLQGGAETKQPVAGALQDDEGLFVRVRE